MPFIHKSARSFSWMWKDFQLEKVVSSFIKVFVKNLAKIYWQERHHPVEYLNSLYVLSSLTVCILKAMSKQDYLPFDHGSEQLFGLWSQNWGYLMRYLIFSPHFQSGPLYPDKGTRYPFPSTDSTTGKKAGIAGKTQSDSQLIGRETSISMETHGTHGNSNWGERSIRSFTVVYMSICLYILTIYITLCMHHVPHPLQIRMR